jgi:hypothetical protein
MQASGLRGDGERPTLGHSVGKIEVFESRGLPLSCRIEAMIGEHGAPVAGSTCAEPLCGLKDNVGRAPDRRCVAGGKNAARGRCINQKEPVENRCPGRRFPGLDYEAADPKQLRSPVKGRQKGLEIPGLQSYVVVEEVDELYRRGQVVDSGVALSGAGRGAGIAVVPHWSARREVLRHVRCGVRVGGIAPVDD